MGNTVKKVIRKIHLWLGLASGLVVFIVSLTGCIYVFQEEICLLFQTGVFRNVETQNTPFISPLTIKEKVEDAFEGEITYMNVSVYPKGDRVTIVWMRDQDRKYQAFLLNPYSGEIIHSYPYNLNFWGIVLFLHTSLGIPGFGHHIVAIATLIFVILLISGLFLWLPKSKKGYKQRFSIKWGASPRRLNYDLHNVLGFYMTWVAIFIAVSGLIWSYSWMDQAIYWLASGGKTPEQAEVVTSVYQNTQLASQHVIDDSLQQIIKQHPGLNNYYLVYPADSTSAYSLTLNTEAGFFYNRHDTYFLDQYTGDILDEVLWKDKNNGDKLQEANYNIHVGAILGLPGKIIAFFASLIATSLPVTGFLIWWGRGKKKKGKHRYNNTSAKKTDFPIRSSV